TTDARGHDLPAADPCHGVLRNELPVDAGSPGHDAGLHRLRPGRTEPAHRGHSDLHPPFDSLLMSLRSAPPSIPHPELHPAPVQRGAVPRTVTDALATAGGAADCRSWQHRSVVRNVSGTGETTGTAAASDTRDDRKSTRLNSSHVSIS